MKKYLVLGLAALVMMTVVSPQTALAGGNGRGGGGREATLSVDQDPVIAECAFRVDGAGFRANRLVVVGVSGLMPFETVNTDGSGAFSYVYTQPLAPDPDYLLVAYEYGGKGWTLKASLVFSAVEGICPA